MKGEVAKYLGKIVNREQFRVFIYSADDQKRLVESYDEFEMYMATGVWFATIEEAQSQNELKKQDEKIKKARAKKQPVAVEDKEEPVEEIKDDFLPKESE